MPDDRALIKATPQAAAAPRRRVRHELPQPRVLQAPQRHKIALVVADNPGQWPIITEITTDLMYVRLHGHDQLYASGYSDRELDEWATKINSWTERGCDVYVYCDNDAKVRAPYDAMGLMDRLGLSAAVVDPGVKRGGPPHTRKSSLPLLPSSPGGVGRGIATRRTRDEVYSDRLESMSLDIISSTP